MSVDEIGIYKPDPRVYEIATLRYRVFPHAISFQSSNRWDVAGAAKFGFRTVWIKPRRCRRRICRHGARRRSPGPVRLNDLA